MADESQPAAVTVRTSANSSEHKEVHRRADGSLLPGHPHAWRPGQSGNPAGRPSREREVTQAARSLAIEGLENLADVMRDKRAQGMARVRAVEIIMERAYGKAPQKVLVDTDTAGMDNAALVAFIRSQLRMIENTIDGEAEAE